MDEHIKREEIRRAYEKLTRSYVNGNPYIADWRFDEMIEKLPATDVAPVVHGRGKCEGRKCFVQTATKRVVTMRLVRVRSATTAPTAAQRWTEVLIDGC